MNSPTVMEGTGRDEEDDENGDSYYDDDSAVKDNPAVL